MACIKESYFRRKKVKSGAKKKEKEQFPFYEQ